MIEYTNPFNIRYTKSNRWLGLVGQKDGFCVFCDREHGVRAACILIMRTYRRKGCKTIDSILYRYAPPSENNTKKYISFIENRTTIKSYEILSSDDYPSVLSAMSEYEVGFGNHVFPLYISDVISKYKIKIYPL